MKTKLSVLTALATAVLVILTSTMSVFAYDTTAISTGDSRTIIFVTLGIILVAALVAIILLSRKK
ncbi:MAG: LPXTG cell wall anchor domain-containing protein [Acutalibacteraceae bacterium]|nr:LPXTG cell wall anchor domain-containing protein [Acutalibacteraceae bacterium]